MGLARIISFFFEFLKIYIWVDKSRYGWKHLLRLFGATIHSTLFTRGHNLCIFCSIVFNYVLKSDVCLMLINALLNKFGEL